MTYQVEHAWPAVLWTCLALACPDRRVGAQDIAETKHYGPGIAWLQFDYPAIFLMDPKSHEGEAKWWARLTSPDAALSVEVSSFGYCPEYLKKDEGYASPENYVKSVLVGKSASQTHFSGYERFIDVNAKRVNVVFLKEKADWGKCFQELRFSFAEGSYEHHRDTIMKIIQSARPSFSRD